MPATLDRRAAHKARTRQAIVTAAAQLMDETAGAGFSVDELATRADVARRTVFNHFGSLSGVVAAVGADSFRTIHDALVACPVGSTVRADLVEALRRSDLVGPMASLTRGLGLGDPAVVQDGPEVPADQAMLLLRSLAELSDDLGVELQHRHPGAERVDIDLEVAGVLGGLVVLHRYWFAATGGGVDNASRRAWIDLLDRLAPVAEPSHHVPEGHHG